MDESEKIGGILFFVLVAITGVISTVGIVHEVKSYKKNDIVIKATTFEKEFSDIENNKTFVITVSVNEKVN